MNYKMSIVRGLVLGGSFGIFFALASGSILLQSAFTGSVAGGLAGYTAAAIAQKRKAKKDSENTHG